MQPVSRTRHLISRFVTGANRILNPDHGRSAALADVPRSFIRCSCGVPIHKEEFYHSATNFGESSLCRAYIPYTQYMLLPWDVCFEQIDDKPKYTQDSRVA